jgi:hypothetical protein
MATALDDQRRAETRTAGNVGETAGGHR